MQPVIRRYCDATDRHAVHTLFANGMKDNMNSLIFECCKNIPGVKELCVALPALVFTGSWRGGQGSLETLPFGCRLEHIFTALAAAAVPLAVSLKLWRSMLWYINHSLNDDLKDINGFYKHPSAFWVAELNGEVVGCTALQSHDPETGELRRMSVKSGLRRCGVAKQLGLALISHAQATGHKKVFLTTTSGQKPALALYKRLGWVETKVWHSYGYGLTFHKLELDVPPRSQ